MTFTFDVGVVAGAVGLLLTLGGIIRSLFGLWGRFRKLEQASIYRKEDTEIMFVCLRAILETMNNLGDSEGNKRITTALERLNAHTTQRASGTGAKR